jgi:hypothetical protein
MSSKPPVYTIRPAPSTPGLAGLWEEPAWQAADILSISNWHERSSEHRPRVEARVTYRGEEIYVFFRVHDRYVRSVQTAYQSSVCRDSCVEFFAEPAAGRGYLNFEINAGGTLLLYHIEDATRAPGGFRKHRPVDESWGRRVRIHHSLPAVVDPEIATDTLWTIEYAVPLALFEAYVGPLPRPLAGQTWRGNFFKCADATSHPHWGTWAPVPGPLNFHVPAAFAPLHFLG